MDIKKPVIRVRSEHRISRRDIDPDALKVLYRLVRCGHTAYLVGGSVRDLLLSRQPKDFDIGTDARPRQIKKLFRNCFLIGRRFRLAHIKYGNKIIETSTFRRQPEPETDPSDPEASLLQRRDNTFGTPSEDARRRDFTLNGLFYDIETFSVIDYVGGLQDLDAGLIRCIGDPDIRFREDPVRMIRAVRFAARLGFSIEKKTLEAIGRHYPEIEKAAPARLLEEVYRLFGFRSGEAAFRLLQRTSLLSVIFPELDRQLTGDADEAACFWQYLRALDAGDTVVPEPTPALMFGTMIYDTVHGRLADLGPGKGRTAETQVIRESLQPLTSRVPIPKRVADRMVRMFQAQRRFLTNSSRRFSKSRFVAQEIYPEALALCEIHTAATGGDLAGLRRWRDLYEEHLENSAGTPCPAVSSLKASGQTERPPRQRRKRRSSRRNKKRSVTAGTGNGKGTSDASGSTSAPSTEAADSAPPKQKRPTGKKSRRRRTRANRPASKKDAASAEAVTLAGAKDTDSPIGPLDYYLGKKTKSKDAGNKRPAPEPPSPASEPRVPDTARPERDAPSPHWMDEI